MAPQGRKTATAPPAAERRRRYRSGLVSEALAAALLRAKGYRILARRARTRYGEIDIVALRGRRLAFIEVKRRKTPGDAALAVTPRQRERLMRASQAWMARTRHTRHLEPAFDLVLVVPWRLPRHVRDAIDPLDVTF